jgi:DHA1 family multidrug resistance protein-like MFS transporter
VAERFGVGLFIGAIVPTANALIGKLTSTNERGFIFGMTSSVYFLGNSLGPMSGGIVAAGFGLHWVFLMTAILLAGTWALVWSAVPGTPQMAHRR